MPSSYFTELALRTAVNTTSRDLSTDTTSLAQTIKNSALKCSQQLLQGSANNAQLNLEKAEIGMAVAGLALAYSTIATELNAMDTQRLAFDKERIAGISTFIIPTNKEERELSRETKIIKDFINLGKDSSFASYLGIHLGNLSQANNIMYYSIIPFYRMSAALTYHASSRSLLDCQRNMINLFFKTELAETIYKIELDFRADTRFISFCEAIVQGSNYLNDLRVPRFIIMALANLLWNLQHPVDQITGYPLCVKNCIELCVDIEIYLNQLLNTQAPPYLQFIKNSKNLTSIIHKIEIYTKELHAAYLDRYLHELNIDEITSISHSTLMIMCKSSFQLIYQRNNILSKKSEPDDTTAEKISDTLSYLNLLLIRQKMLTNALVPLPNRISTAAFMNNPPQTIIDVLIIFCHLSPEECTQLLARFNAINNEIAQEFTKSLSAFVARFIQPIKKIHYLELDATILSPKHQEIGRLTARRLMPLFSLLFANYQLELNNPAVLTRSYNAKAQIKLISRDANDDYGYYTYIISPFIKSSSNMSTEIDELPKLQYRMTQLTELLDNIAFLVKNYNSFLQNKLFNAFLLKSFAKIKTEYAKLNNRINIIDRCLSQDASIGRGLKNILSSMIKNLNKSMESFAFVTTNFERIINSPDFSDHQRDLLSAKLEATAKQFSELFAEDSGLAELIDAPILPPAPVRSHPPQAKSCAIIALNNLITECYNSLSTTSRNGRKGWLLKQLLKTIEDTTYISDIQIKQMILELTNIAASYRETWFFQAPYGESRGGYALRAAIKDRTINQSLPLAATIFGKDIDLQTLEDKHILSRLKDLRIENQWPEATEQIKLSANI